MTRVMRLRLAAFVLIGILVGTLVMPAAATADAVYPTGSRLGLVPMTGLVVTDRFPGFEDKRTGASVLILDMAARAHPDVGSLMGKEALQKQGIIEERRESFDYKSGKGTLIAGRQKGNRNSRKWILLASVPDATALIVVEVPDDAKDTYSEAAVRSMLASLAIRPRVPIDEQLSLLPLRFDEFSGMRPVRVIGRSGAVLTSGPKDTLEASEQPLLIVSIGRGGPEGVQARDTFARNLLSGVGDLKEVRIVGADMLRLGGGLQTHQLFVEARDAKTKEPMKLVQWIRFGSGAFLRILGIANAEDWSDAFPRFRAVRDGVNPRG